MPLVIDLLLLDEAQNTPDCEGGGRIGSAKGIFAEIERQLQDASSHLRRKSAFGALIARGASVRFVRCEQHERAPLPAVDAAAAGPAAPGDASDRPFAAPRRPDIGGTLSAIKTVDASCNDWSVSPEDSHPPSAHHSAALTPPVCPTPSRGFNSPATPLCRLAEASNAVPIPSIKGFPRGKGPRSSGASSGSGFFSSFFNWWPSCSAPPCGTPVHGQRQDTCTIVLSEPTQMLAPCVFSPKAGSRLTRTEELAAQHEAGVGGWPLCVPHAFVGFPEARGSIVNASSNHGAGARAQGPSTPTSPATPVAAGYAKPFAAKCTSRDSYAFQKAALEVDDVELVIIASCRPSGFAKYAQAMTPSTASTADPPPTPTQAAQGLAFNRLVFPRDQINSVKHVGKGDELALCATPEPATHARGADHPGGSPSTDVRLPTSGDAVSSPPWSHIVELVGRPAGSPRTLAVRIALPCAALATRLHDALTKQRRSRESRSSKMTSTALSSLSVSSNGSTITRSPEMLGAVRCELHIAAKMEIASSLQWTNCAAVVRRGICEACHIGADRIRVCGLREGNGGPVALEPVLAPVVDASPPPADFPVPSMPAVAPAPPPTSPHKALEDDCPAVAEWSDALPSPKDASPDEQPFAVQVSSAPTCCRQAATPQSPSVTELPDFAVTGSSTPRALAAAATSDTLQSSLDQEQHQTPAPKMDTMSIFNTGLQQPDVGETFAVAQRGVVTSPREQDSASEAVDTADLRGCPAAAADVLKDGQKQFEVAPQNVEHTTAHAGDRHEQICAAEQPGIDMPMEPCIH